MTKEWSGWISGVIAWVYIMARQSVSIDHICPFHPGTVESESFWKGAVSSRGMALDAWRRWAESTKK